MTKTNSDYNIKKVGKTIIVIIIVLKIIIRVMIILVIMMPMISMNKHNYVLVYR